MIRASNNPFRSECVEAVRYQLQGSDWSRVVGRLESMRYRGSIVGSHGSGKTTMLEELQRQLNDRGYRTVLLFTNTSHGRSLPGAWRDALCDMDDETIVLADGYDVLGVSVRWYLRRRVRRLVVTAHHGCRLARLWECESCAQVLVEIVDQLGGEGLALIEAQAMLDAHRGNMREVIWALYDGVSRP